MSRNSASLSAKENGSSPLPESAPSRPDPPPPPPLGLSMRSPATNSLLPGSTYSRSPRSRERWNCGSPIPSVGIETAPPLPASAMVRSATALSTARLTSARVRRRNRWRLPRLLSRGLRRRSTNCAMLSGLVDPHVPLDQTADLALGVAARFHPIEEIGVLLLGLGVLLGPEADDRQQVFDLAEHALLDHLTDLLIGGPRGILALVGGAGAQRELDDLVAEVLGIGDAGRLLRLGKLRVEHLPVEDLSGVRILEVLLLDPGVGVGDVPVEQVLPIFAVGFDVGLLDFTADELGVARREVRLDEVEIAVLDVLRILLALDRLLKHVHQMDGIGGDLLDVEVEGLGQHLEGEAGGDARHPLRDARRLAVFLHRLRLGVGVLEALAVVDAQLRIERRILVLFEAGEDAEARQELEHLRRAGRLAQLAGLEEFCIDHRLLSDAEAIGHLDHANAVEERLVVLVVLELLPLGLVRVGEHDALERQRAEVLGAGVVPFLGRGQKRMQHLDRRLEHLDEFQEPLGRSVEAARVAVGVRVVLREMLELADVDLADKGGDVLVVLVAGLGLGDADLAQLGRVDLDDGEPREVAVERVEALGRPGRADAGEAPERDAVAALERRGHRFRAEEAE